MLFEDVNQLLNPDYLPMETGFCRLPNGQMYVAVLTRMPGCKGKWVDWWFKTRFTDNALDKSSVRCDLKIKSNSYSISTKNQLKFSLFERLNNSNFVFEDPNTYFDTSMFKAANISTVICGKLIMPDGIASERVIYLVRDTNDGCEMRSRFWLYNANEENALKVMQYCLSEMNVLADILKMHIEELRKTDGKGVMCKYCHSSDLIKNGLHNNSQYWRCKSCGRSFVNNMAYPKMKYPFDVITSAVKDLYDGKPLSVIRSNIEKEIGIMPSYSTIYRWEKALKKLVKTKIQN